MVSTGVATSPVHNPSSGEVIAETPLSAASDVDRAVQAARQAFAGWGAAPALKRAAVLFRYRELLELNFNALARLVTRENGKTLAAYEAIEAFKRYAPADFIRQMPL